MVARLPEALIDQIAAGEVVERPASVVKELVENALDAGASRVWVEIRGGGIDGIVVRDDGHGMSAANAALALERHATSKLRSAADLDRIASFGFRGEALPAIASVSRFRLRTRSADEREGIELNVEAGGAAEARPAAAAQGTRVEVADLFANLPARRKFLKKPATEWRHIVDWLARAALARPDVHFDIQRDGKPALQWPAVLDARERVAAVLSVAEAEALVEVASEVQGLRVAGFTSRPDAHRPTSQSLYLFVNGRPVRDRLLRHAILEVYRDVLPRARFPAAVLFVDVPEGEVDVNVHPAKWEVRFRDPRAVHQAVGRALRDALAQRAWLGGTSSVDPAPTTRDRHPQVRDTPLRHPASASGGTSDWTLARDTDGLVARESDAGPEDAPLQNERFRLSDQTLHGQFHACYLLVEGRSGLLLVDQHAAHERVLYEDLRASYRAKAIARQALLVPTPVELAPAGAATLHEALGEALSLGFELEVFGDRSVVVRAVPALLAERSPELLVRELAETLGGEEVGRLTARGLDGAEAVFATMACHSARRAGERLEPEEQHAILAGLDRIPWSPTCPHGRPVVVPIPLAEIERRFGRT